MTASDFARVLLVHSDDSFIRIVDVEPLKQTLHNLLKQGTNLNQLMKNLNTNEVSSYTSDKAQQTLGGEAETFEQVANAIIALREEMAEHGVALSDGDDGTIS